MKTKALLILNLFFTGSIVSGVGQPPAPPPDFPGNEYKKLYEETVILADQATQILADLNQSIELSGIEFSKREKELLQIRLVKKEKESKLAEYKANLILKNEEESVLSQNLNDLISGTQKMEEEIKLLTLQIEEFPRKLESLNQELVTVEKEIVESTRKLKVPHLPSWYYVDGKGCFGHLHLTFPMSIHRIVKIGSFLTRAPTVHGSSMITKVKLGKNGSSKFFLHLFSINTQLH